MALSLSGKGFKGNNSILALLRISAIKQKFELSILDKAKQVSVSVSPASQQAQTFLTSTSRLYISAAAARASSARSALAAFAGRVPWRRSSLEMTNSTSLSPASSSSSSSSSFSSSSSSSPPSPPPSNHVSASKQEANSTNKANSSSSSSTSTSSASSFSFSAWWKSHKVQLREMISSYGYFSVATYFTIYVTTLVSVYNLVKFGVLTSPDPRPWVKNLWIKKKLFGEEAELPDWGVDMANAWLYTKLTEPARVVVTLFLVPLLASRLPPRFLAVFGVKKGMVNDLRR